MKVLTKDPEYDATNELNYHITNLKSIAHLLSQIIVEHEKGKPLRAKLRSGLLSQLPTLR